MPDSGSLLIRDVSLTKYSTTYTYNLVYYLMYIPDFFGDLVEVLSVASLTKNIHKLSVVSYDYQLKVLLTTPLPVLVRVCVSVSVLV